MGVLPSIRTNAFGRQCSEAATTMAALKTSQPVEIQSRQALPVRSGLRFRSEANYMSIVNWPPASLAREQHKVSLVFRCSLLRT